MKRDVKQRKLKIQLSLNKKPKKIKESFYKTKKNFIGSFTVKNPEFTIWLDFYLFCVQKYNEYLCLLVEFTLDPLSNTGISPSPAYRTVLEINGFSVAIFLGHSPQSSATIGALQETEARSYATASPSPRLSASIPRPIRPISCLDGFVLLEWQWRLLPG